MTTTRDPSSNDSRREIANRGSYAFVPADDNEIQYDDGVSTTVRRRADDESPPVSWMSILILLTLVLCFFFEGIPIIVNLVKGKGFSLTSGTHEFWSRSSTSPHSAKPIHLHTRIRHPEDSATSRNHRPKQNYSEQDNGAKAVVKDPPRRGF